LSLSSWVVASIHGCNGCCCGLLLREYSRHRRPPISHLDLFFWQQ
jgi:hypothetical protein